MQDLSNRKMPVLKREIFGWALYDFANSSYTTVVLTAFYSSFFVKYIVPKGDPLENSYWSIAIMASTLCILFLAPAAGAVCDHIGRKKFFLTGTTLLCALGTMLLYFVGPGDVALGIGIVIFSNIAFMMTEVFCASFLPELASKKTMAKISAFGWGVGYFGGLASVALVFVMVSANPSENLDLFVRQNQTSMVAVGIFFLVAALPTLLLVRSRDLNKNSSHSLFQLFELGLQTIKNAYKIVRSEPVLFRFLIAFMVYIAGLDAVINFVGIYARSEIQFETQELTYMFLIIQVSAAAGALLFGFLEGFLGAKNTVLATLAMWVAAIMCMYFLSLWTPLFNLSAKEGFFLICLVAGAGLGATQSSSRAIVGILAPADKMTQVFGFWGTFGRLGTILGVCYGFAADYFDRRHALLLVAGFFLVGGFLLSKVPIPKSNEA